MSLFVLVLVTIPFALGELIEAWDFNASPGYLDSVTSSPGSPCYHDTTTGFSYGTVQRGRGSASGDQGVDIGSVLLHQGAKLHCPVRAVTPVDDFTVVVVFR